MSARSHRGQSPGSTGSGIGPGLVVHARICAGAAAVGGLFHVLMLNAGTLMALITAIMLCACIPCTIAMWMKPSPGTARMVVGMSLAMALLHGGILLSAPPQASHAHSGSTVGPAAPGPAAPGPSTAHVGHAAAMIPAMTMDFIASALGSAWIRRRLALRPATDGMVAAPAAVKEI